MECSNFQKLRVISYILIKNRFHDNTNFISDFQNSGCHAVGTRFWLYAMFILVILCVTYMFYDVILCVTYMFYVVILCVTCMFYVVILCDMHVLCCDFVCDMHVLCCDFMCDMHVLFCDFLSDVHVICCDFLWDIVFVVILCVTYVFNVVILGVTYAFVVILAVILCVKHMCHVWFCVHVRVFVCDVLVPGCPLVPYFSHFDLFLAQFIFNEF